MKPDDEILIITTSRECKQFCVTWASSFVKMMYEISPLLSYSKHLVSMEKALKIWKCYLHFDVSISWLTLLFNLDTLPLSLFKPDSLHLYSLTVKVPPLSYYPTILSPYLTHPHPPKLWKCKIINTKKKALCYNFPLLLKL